MYGRWFIVASQKNVKVLTENSEERGKFKELKEFDNPLGRVRNRELIRKQAGSGMRSLGTVGSARYSMTKSQDLHEQAAIEFAKNVTEYLESARQKNEFETLTVVAEPNFLGKIRSAMRPQLKKLVSSWVKKDMQKTPKLELTKFLLQTSLGK